ncbi:[FeFe] hydrogenase H-cluster maturation GTPase HydF [Anaerostipes sp. MSJ-23]|uniref:[FeFe] hydrogenase H-cluster maturation GTPase HydF n=1 Tax=unclassified Anaerostipes TaxID=2635253 RepID=UPI001C122545|nr:[FeFe] hydrogenase H-cluster maturation GTPase HydF [Anaerostipes sp. MSJ-23]MBU5458940.1 [FeFe] hydrogenase H-cluster maturation GTPase HydF [Anaerostipes sp. MSJ-23]
MSLNQTPRGDRLHIALFGKRNAGKSSVINALTNQELAIVSDIKGTTTDPVYKAMELLPLGPVVMIDTPGLDDEGELGEKRVKKAKEVLNKADIALVVIDAQEGITDFEKDMIHLIEEKKIPYLKVYNKMDLHKNIWQEDHAVFVSAMTKEGIFELKEKIGKLVPSEEEKFQIVGDLIQPSDFVVLVVPIDKAAPKGRLILPQQQTIRDILESDATAIVVKEYELRETLEALGKKPSLVITDSQVFSKVAADVPKDIMLTSFSILFARYKGDLEEEVKGVKALEQLKEGAKILIAEGCTHHRQCDDIGTVKIPRWLGQYTGKEFEIHTSSGNTFPDDLASYDLVIHCGGCTLNRREMKNRIARVKEAGVPIVNYGILIAAIQGILKRSLQPFPLASMILDEI